MIRSDHLFLDRHTSSRLRARLVAYAVAVLGPVVSLLVRLHVGPDTMDERAIYIVFCPAVMIAAYLGGLRPGLLATFLSATAVNYFFIDPVYTLWISTAHDAVALFFFTLVGTFISFLCESLHRSRLWIAANERRYAVTLASIGDAIIATDDRGRVTFLNPVAEALTGWPPADAVGRPLTEVFRIVNEQTRQPVEDPAAKVLRLGTVVGLANHTVLVARDGREVPIDDCGAPIIDDRGAISGVVLVFRDVGQRRQAEAAEVLRRANERMELAVRGSNVGIWDIEMSDGDYEHGRRHYMNIWEQFGLERPPDGWKPDSNEPAREGRDRLTWTAGAASRPPWESAAVRIHPDDRLRAAETIRRYLDGETPAYETEIRFQRKDGSYRTVLTRGAAVRNAAGKPIRFVGIIIDITRLKAAEEALSQERYLLHALMDNIPDMIYFKDTASRFLRVNKALADFFGLSDPAQAVGKTDSDFFREEHARPAYEDEQEIMRTGEPMVGKEEKAVRRDGLVGWASTTKMPLRDKDGAIIGTFGVSRNITNLKLAEEALRASEQRFRTFVDHAADAFFLHDEQGRILDVNHRACESLGYTRDEMIGMTPFDFDPDLTPELVEDRIRTLKKGETLAFESRHRRKDGTIFPVELRGKTFEEGGQGFLVTLARDMTDRKRAEEALRESEQRFRTLTEALPNIVWTAKPDGALDYVNVRITEYTGLTPEQILGWGWKSVIHPEELSRFLEAWTRSITTGQLYEYEFRLRLADGAYHWHLSRALPLRDDARRITKWVGFAIDIDDQKNTQEALRQAKEAAEAANQAKDEFLANVSHEIRTPMNAILGMTELALDTPLTAEQRDYLAIVKSSADALLRVINDLLDFAKIEAGKLELDHVEFSLRHVLGDTLRALALRAHRKGLELACRVPPDVPDALIGDAGRLRQILLNLIGNAIKFTEQGEVVVRVEAGVDPTSSDPSASLPGSPPWQVLNFSISDTGIGIPHEKQEKIFKAFEQVDSSTTRQYEGTGLGLSIAARLVALMGGHITVESEPGRGSTFRFTAQFAAQAHPSGGPHEQPLVDLHGLRVLVVDDNATNRQILDEWLRSWHTDPLSVADGFQALDALWSAASVGRPFTLVLLDARMPGTDGLAVAATILRNPVLSQCRIILLTSDDLHGDIARYRELGIAACAMKPVQQEELLDIVYRVLSRPDRADADAGPMDGAAASAETGASPHRLRILVAEDNPFNQKLAEHLLRRKGHNVRVAGDGREALAALEQDGFDLMLLDVHMPGCDGFEVIARLRQREQATGAHLPVIAMTARAMRSDRERCLQAGMDDFLAKPIAASDLFLVVDRVLAGRPAAERDLPARGTPGTLLDPAALLAACDGDATLLRALIQVFQADTPGALTKVSEAVRAADAPRLWESAHELRGLLSTFSAAAAEAAARLEAMGAGGQLDDAAATLDALAEIVGRLGPQLDALSIEELRRQAARDEPA